MGRSRYRRHQQTPGILFVEVGRYAFGNRLVVAETDEETLDTYSGRNDLHFAARADFGN